MIPNKDEIVVSPTEPLMNRQKFWLRKGKNVYDGVIVPGLIDQINNGIIGSSSFTVAGINYIPVKANLPYTISAKYETLSNINNRDIGIYDKNKSFIKVIAWDNKLITITPEQDGFIRLGYDKNCYDVMVEQNLEKTEYEAYVKPILYVKNSNGNYEKVLEEKIDENLIFSYTKFRIGTWVDGRPLYGKVIPFKGITVTTDGTYPASPKVINIEESNVDFYVLGGCWFVLQNGQRYNMPYISNSGGVIKAFLDNIDGNCRILTISNSTAFTEVDCGAFVIFTKTTD